MIARDILPALLIEFGAFEPRRAPAVPQGFSSADRMAYVDSVLTVPAERLVDITEAYIDLGHTLEQILLDLLAPAARQLGVMWERDDISFVDVTIAVQNMQRVICELSRANPAPLRAPATRQPTVFLAPLPGETHTFGLFMIAEVLRRRGWHVAGGLPVETRALAAHVAATAYTMIGFSVSCDANLKSARAAIRSARKHSLNPNVQVVAGGRVFEGRSDLAHSIGADRVFYEPAEMTTYCDQLATAVQRMPS